MILISFLSIVFWALIIAIALWVLCAYVGRLVNPSYRLPALMHLLCFGVAVCTVVLLSVVFTLNKVNKFVKNNTIVKILMDDKGFIKQLNQQIENANSITDTEKINDYIAQNIADNISNEYPILGKLVDVKKLQDNIDIKQLTGTSQITDVNMALQAVQKTTTSYVNKITSTIKSARRKALIPVILLQLIVIGTIFYKADKYRSPAQSNYIYESSDYL